MYKIQLYIRNNIQYLLLALSLVSGAIVVIPFGTQIYMAGLFYLLFYSLVHRNSSLYFGRYYILFLIACVLSCITTDSINYRLFAFIAIVFACTPITISKELFLFRKAYLKHCLMIFPVLSLISLLCYICNINYCTIKGNALDFSAIFPHPMWLGAAVGLSNIVIIWLMFLTKNRIIQLLSFILLLLSIYISVVAASRAALLASLLSVCLFIILKINDVKKIIIIGLAICIATVMLLPIYLSGAERMQRKFDGSKGEYGSRTELFTIGFKHFEENPIFGVGFAVSYNAKGEKNVGRLEAGSGWLSILFQTGIMGFSVISIIMFKLCKVFRYIREDYELLLFMFAFMYVCLHSFFEGYILTVGYYPCILFWSLLSYLYTYPYYKEIEFYMKKV